MISMQDTVSLVKVQGKRIRKQFEDGYVSLPETRGGFVIFSQSAYVEVNCQKSPGERIERFLIDGSELEDDKFYLYSDMSFIMGGRDGFTPFEPTDFVQRFEDNEIGVILSYLSLAEDPQHEQEFRAFKNRGIACTQLNSLVVSEKGLDAYSG